MDARITKQRLGNLISYDWLKMLVTIVVFVLVLVLLFTMTATRPKNTQEYSIYAYTDLTATSSFTNLGDTLEERDVLSYDILAINSESFAGNNYASATYSARRAAGQGTVMFITDNPVYETDDNGDYVLDEDGNIVYTDENGTPLDPQPTSPDPTDPGATDPSLPEGWEELYPWWSGEETTEPGTEAPEGTVPGQDGGEDSVPSEADPDAEEPATVSPGTEEPGAAGPGTEGSDAADPETSDTDPGEGTGDEPPGWL